MKNFKSEIHYWTPERHRRYIIGNIIHFGAFIIGAIAFFAILGIIGHSDFCMEAGIADDWSQMTYRISLSISVVVMLLCMKLFELGARIRGYYFDFC